MYVISLIFANILKKKILWKKIDIIELKYLIKFLRQCGFAFEISNCKC